MNSSVLHDIILLLQPLPVLYLTGLFIFGLLVGSFLNVVILRLPIMMTQDFKAQCRLVLDMAAQTAPALSLSKPASHCPACGHRVLPWHNLPVVSYLYLRGRCAYCQSKISPRYPIVELSTGILTAYSIWHLGLSPMSLATLLLLWALIALTLIDYDTQLLPDSITLPLLWLGLLCNSFSLITDLPSAVWGAVWGYLSLWSVYWLFKLITGKEGMGYGDFKLLAALGAWLGWQSLPMILLLSSFVGTLIGLLGIMILGRDKSQPIPFGPYLAIAGWLSLLFGEQISQYYLQLFAL